jgi:bacteriochlorophyll 4-vinyl reductase
MVDAGIGRLLIASLHQGIADVAPTRLPFYENWLTPPGLRDFKFGLAPLHATLSFLRLEGQPVYDQVMRRAGRYTGDWAHAEMRPLSRAVVRRLPARLRARWALRLSRGLVKQTFRGSRARVRLRNGTGTIDIRASIFCALRETADWPMCVYYSAAVERFLERFDLDAAVDVRQCKASGGDGCTMIVTIRGERRPGDPERSEASATAA